MPPTQALQRGLYALTPTGWPQGRLLSAVDQAIAGGVVAVQYRDKPRPQPEIARALLGQCRAAGVPLIINDDVELAETIGADGVHLGRDDRDPGAARQRLGSTAIIGVSCYNDLTRAARLAPVADYLAFGSVFPSPTKPDAVTCPLPILNEARALGRPIVAIGGITKDNADQVIEAGADLVAIISDLFDAADIRARAAQFRDAFATL